MCLLLAPLPPQTVAHRKLVIIDAQQSSYFHCPVFKIREELFQSLLPFIPHSVPWRQKSKLFLLTYSISGGAIEKTTLFGNFFHIARPTPPPHPFWDTLF